MALTTFTGPVRSLNGFINASQSSTTGEYTNNFVIGTDGTSVTSTALQLQQLVTGTLAATAGDSIATWTQPANTYIDSIDILCTSAPTVATGDIGFEVGTTSSGQEIVTGITDEILDGGTTVAAGALTATTIVRVAASGTTHAADASYTTTARSIYLNLTTSTTASVRGSFKWIIKYTQFA